MYQRDYILTEARKMALLIAKLMGLKTEDNEEEYMQYFNEILHDEYNTELNNLLQANDADFKALLANAGYSAEKLNALSQMLYVFAEPFNADEETASVLNKVLLIFDVLEQKHHYESFDNLNKRNQIYSFFKNNYERI
jgi:endonuclease III